MLREGLEGVSQTVVNHTNTAEAMGSGSLPVFATPALVALVERAACAAVASELPGGHTSVGTRISIAHLRASGLGTEITARATLVAVEGRKLSFAVTASDADGTVGEGEHERFVVETERFMGKIKK